MNLHVFSNVVKPFVKNSTEQTPKRQHHLELDKNS